MYGGSIAMVRDTACKTGAPKPRAIPCNNRRRVFANPGNLSVLAGCPDRLASRGHSGGCDMRRRVEACPLHGEHHEVFHRRRQEGGQRFARHPRYRLVLFADLDGYGRTCRDRYGPFGSELEKSRDPGGGEHADDRSPLATLSRARTRKRLPCSSYERHFPVPRDCR